MKCLKYANPESMKSESGGKMIIFPAIDLKDGRCVRLTKGDFSTVEKVADDIHQTLAAFEKAGAKWVHTVDLDGARHGRQKNLPLILDAVGNSRLNVQFGGGVRDIKTVEHLLSKGIKRVIIGSAAVENPQLLREAARLFPDSIAVGIDADNGLVATQGWVSKSEKNYLELAKEVENTGVKCIIFTDIQRDGTLSGPSLERLSEIKNAVSCSIIASGGVSGIEDIKNLIRMRLYGAICGKSIYSGSLNLAEAIAVAGDQNNV